MTAINYDSSAWSTGFSSSINNYNTNSQTNTPRQSIFRRRVLSSTTPLYNQFLLREETKRTANFKKLAVIDSLEFNWNNNGAEAFSSSLVNTCYNLIYNIIRQPELFPTGRNSIQIEFEKEDGSYLEFEIFENSVEMLYVNGLTDEETEETFELDYLKVNGFILDFYDESRN